MQNGLSRFTQIAEEQKIGGTAQNLVPKSITGFKSYEWLDNATESERKPARRNRNEMRDELFKWLCQGSSPTITSYIGETAFHNLEEFKFTAEESGTVDVPCLVDVTLAKEYGFTLETAKAGDATEGYAFTANALLAQALNVSLLGRERCLLYPVSFAFH